MVSKESSILLDIFNLVYVANDATNIDEKRSNILKHILPLFNAFGATFFLSDQTQNRLDSFSGISYGLEKSYSNMYEKYFYKYEPLNKVIESKLICTTSSRVYPSNQWERLEYYNDFLKPQKIYHELIMCIRSDDALYGKIGIFRHKNDPDFSEDDLEKAKIIARQLERVIKNTKLLEDYQNKIHIYQGLTEIPQIAMIVLDYNLEVNFHNDIAVDMCHQIYKENLHDDSVIWDKNIPVPNTIMQDCAALKDGFQTNQGVFSSYRSSCIYTEQGNKYVSKSYINIQSPDGKGAPCFLVLIEDGTKAQQSKEIAAKLKYGLSDRELEICRFIDEGLTNDDIAQKLFVSRFTIETHIRHLFEKTQAKNRIDLINRLAIN